MQHLNRVGRAVEVGILMIASRKQPSLRRKITLGYYAIAVLVVGVTGFTLLQLSQVEDMVYLGERTSELFDTSLEIRRFERNFFLHRQATDFSENAEYVAKLRRQLDDAGSDLLALQGAARIGQLRALLGPYQQRMADYAAAGDPDRIALAEAAVRSVGKDIVAIAGDMAAGERAAERAALQRSRHLLLAAIAALAVLVFVLGRIISRRIVAPLQEIEKRVAAVPAAPGHRLEAPTGDAEIVAITDACNRMLRELELRQRHLVRAEKLASLGTLLAGVAHELNNPLSNISTSCQILVEEGDAADAETRRRLLAQIDEQTDRVRNIVRSLSDFTRERGFRREAVALDPLLRQTLAFLRGEVPTPVEIVCAVAADVAVAGDSQRLQQALLNLIRNAVEAVAGAGTVTIRATARRLGADAAVAADVADVAAPLAGCDLAGEVVDIEIADDGPGIPEAVLPRIFDPFFTTKEVGRGMGLGLSITHEIIEEHDGCIAVTTAAGRGATFHIRLPAAATLAAAARGDKGSGS
jgi:two-component system NtrC family sensor kinase